jgi:uncharacterized repeat protein (TIGR03803 family)
MKTSSLLTLLLLLPLAAGAQTYTYSTLLDLPSASSQGPVNPNGLTIDDQGNLYTTSESGGVYCAPNGCGTVFEVSPAGVISVLHNFSGPDGSSPRSGVTRDAAGNLYGTTYTGGADVYYGTLYKLAPDGTETVLYSFPNKPPYGNYPNDLLTLDGKGNLFGYTYFTDNNFVTNDGSIFKLTHPDTFSIRYNFGEWGGGGPNGTGPVGSLTKDNAGNFYGATCCGGSRGNGTVFKLTPSGSMTVLYSFNIFSDKIWGPMGSLVRDASGNLYGVGFNGIYEVMASGGEKAFYLDTAGVHLNATITIDSAGNFYGTNQRGGTYGVGAVYKISPQGVETDLYSTPDVALGDGVIFDHAGNMYGTTWHGGTNGTGSIYKLTKSTE